MGIFFKKNKRSFTESPKNVINKNNYKNFIVKAISLIKGTADSREYFSAPEYDLDEIRIASECDSYIKIAIMKYSYMLFKAGYLLKSENEKASDYIKQRFNIMSFATQKPIDILFQEIGDDLIKYSNAFLIKTRVDSIMPGIQAKGFFKDKPIGGYSRIDASTISIQRDANGDVKKYIQFVDGKEKVYDSTDVIHFYLDKNAANAFGTPRITPALEDVKVLRRMEGNVMSLVHRFCMPLFQWIIGLPQTGFQATEREITEARNEIENMPLDGSVVTNEKTAIKSIGAEGTALKADIYLKYFENRVFSALGVSAAQMGRGTTGTNADTMDSQAHDTVKYIQKIFRIFAENFIINELLLEGGFNPILNENDKVHLVFNEISIDTRIKLENHEMNKYQSNMTTFEEMRREIGKKEDVKEDRLYQNMIINKSEKEISELKTKESIEIAKEQGKISLNLAKENTKNATENNVNASGYKGVNPKGNGTEKDKTPNKSISNTNMPENQHGKTSVKIKESLDLSENKLKEIVNHKKNFNSIYIKYNNLRNEITNNPKNSDYFYSLYLTNIMEEIKLEMQVQSVQGINAATKEIEKLKNNKLILPIINISLAPFVKESQETIEQLFIDIKKRTKDNIEENYVKDVFDTLEYRLRFLLEYILPKIYWYSYLKTGAEFKYKKAYIDFGISDDKEKYDEVINLNKIDLEKIPPFHSFCSCKINFKKGEK